VIYCVVPQALAGELLDRLTDYYSDDPNVEVMVDRRAQGGLPGEHSPAKDRRRQRPPGSFPPIDLPANR
jgi:hypothetical protein